MISLPCPCCDIAAHQRLDPPLPGRLTHLCGGDVSCILIVVTNQTFDRGIVVNNWELVKLCCIMTPLPRAARGDTYIN